VLRAHGVAISMDGGQLQSRLVEISAGEQQHPEEHVSTDEPAQKP
jgi:hypothetical protein